MSLPCAEGHAWSRRDRGIYAVAMIPFLVAFVGTAVITAGLAWYLPVILVALHIATSFFQAACCVGCPYRGKFCPAIFGIYLGNVLSMLLYSHRTHDPVRFKRNAMLAEIGCIITLLFAAISVAFASIWYVLALLVLLALHVAVFMLRNCTPGDQSDPSGARKPRIARRRASMRGSNIRSTTGSRRASAPRYLRVSF